MALSSYPIVFDETEIVNPESWEERSEVVETVNVTESGIDQIAVTRYDKLTVSASFQCSSLWARKLKDFSRHDTIRVKMYDVLSDTYVTRVMRIRDFSASLVRNSWKTSHTNGLWNVSFTLKEF